MFTLASEHVILYACTRFCFKVAK